MVINIGVGDVNNAGGSERAAINLAEMLCDQHDVTIVSLGKAGIPFFFINPKIKLKYLNLDNIPTGLPSKLSWFLKLFFILKMLIKREKADVFFGLGHNISSVLALVKSKHTTVVACEHIDFDSISGFSKKIMSWTYPKLDALIVLSDMAAIKVMHLNGNIRIIPNSLPFQTDVLSTLESQKIIMAGRISKEKGYERVIPLAKKLYEDFPMWEINIFGNGRERENLVNLLKQEDVKNVNLLNPVKNIKSEYLRSSILMITSYDEAMPMVILEAHHCGLPVVGYYCEGTASLINDKVSGYIAHDETEFYEYLSYLIRNREERNKMGANARKESEKYAPLTIKKMWLNFIGNDLK